MGSPRAFSRAPKTRAPSGLERLGRLHHEPARGFGTLQLREGNSKLTVEAVTVLAPPVEETWRYLGDSAHIGALIAHEPGDEVRMTSMGPLALGAGVEMRGEFRGRKMVMEARVSEFEPGRKLTLEYTSGPFRGSKKIYSLEPGPGGNGTKITHVSIGDFHGMWRLMAFLLRPTVRRGLKKSAEDEIASITKSLSR